MSTTPNNDFQEKVPNTGWTWVNVTSHMVTDYFESFCQCFFDRFYLDDSSLKSLKKELFNE